MWLSSRQWRLVKSVLGFAAIQVVALSLAGVLALTLQGPWARGARAPDSLTPAPESVSTLAGTAAPVQSTAPALDGVQ